MLIYEMRQVLTLGAGRSCGADLPRLSDAPHLDVINDHTALLGVGRPTGLPETTLSPKVVGGMLSDPNRLVPGSAKMEEGEGTTHSTRVRPRLACSVLKVAIRASNCHLFRE